MSATTTVARETEARRWVVPAALTAAFVPLVAGIVLQLIIKTPPKNLGSTLLFLNEKNPAAAIAGSIGALGVCVTAAVLVFLYDAIKARKPSIRPAFRYAAIAGPLITGLAQAASQIATAHASSTFTNGAVTWQRAEDLTQTGLPQAVGLLGLLGTFIFAGTFVVLSLNAMSVGLVPKAMGYVGVAAGVLLILPLLPVPIVLAFWLIALALLITGRFPGGVPPAWATGEAIPWPSLSRASAPEESGDSARRSPAPAAPRAAPSRPTNPGAARRKRKKRA